MDGSLLLILILSCMQTAISIITVCPPPALDSNKSEKDSDSLSLTQTLLNIPQDGSPFREICLQPGEYTLEKVIPAFSVSGISLIGNSENASEVIVSCDKMSGLMFTMTSNITIANLTISGCSQIVENTHFGNITTALYIDDCDDVTISNVVIANTKGVGLFAINLHGNCVFEGVVFENNTGVSSTSGGAFLVFQDDDDTSKGLRNNTVEFSNCTFERNSVASIVDNDVMNGGSGLKVVLSQVSYQVNLRLSSSHFYANSAKYGAGLLLAITTLTNKHILYNSWPWGVSWNISIEGCLFDSNRASVGASALLVYKDEVCAIAFNRFVISDCVFIDNVAASNSLPTLGPMRLKGTTISIQHVNISLQGSNEFTRNHGTPTEIISSELSICGDVHVFGNEGIHGSGFRLLGTATILLCWHGNSLLNFTGNSDLSADDGAVIYVGPADDRHGFMTGEDYDPCFINFDMEPGDCSNFNAVVTPIVNFNYHSNEGFAVFGSTLKNCLWAECLLNIKGGESAYGGLTDKGIFDFGNSTAKNFSTLVNSIQLCTAGNVSVMPGQLFQMRVKLLDRFTQSVTGIVNAAVVQGNASIVSNAIGPWFVSDTGTAVVSLSLQGIPDQTVTLSIYAVDDRSTIPYTEIEVTLLPCLIGFQFDNVRKQCTCDDSLSRANILCDVKSGFVSTPGTVWFGPINNENENSTIVLTKCNENYCKADIVTISNNDFDFKCTTGLNRRGVGCGACMTNHSAMLGSNQCQECTNYSLFLVVLFFITGILTVAGITLLRITITEGYLNAVLFYSNIVHVYAVFFVPSEHGTGAFFLTAWISQNFGIPACFYDGMTNLTAMGLHLLYIVYLISLTVLLSLILKCKQLPWSDQFAPSKVVATLLVICYTSLLETCVEIISFTRVTTLDGEVYIRWYFDANVVYFSGLHAALSVLAILIILLYIIPFPFLMISPRLIYKVRFFNKLQPLLDTFWGPFKPKFNWWLSFRLFLRWIPIFVASFVPAPTNIVVMTLLCGSLLFVQSQVKPFRGQWQNLLDETLVLNLLLLFSGYFFFSDQQIDRREVYSGVLVVCAYLQFGAVFMHHILSRFPNCKPFLSELPTKLRNFSLNRPAEVSDMEEISTAPPVITHSEITISKEQKEEDKRNLIQEVIELESQSAAATGSSHAMVNPNASTTNSLASEEHGTMGGYRVSLSESENRNSFPLRLRHSFAEDREPLLADVDNV